jgi:hypothetical protein
VTLPARLHPSLARTTLVLDGSTVAEVVEGPGCQLETVREWLADRYGLDGGRLVVRDDLHTIEGERVTVFAGASARHAVACALVDGDLISLRITAETTLAALPRCAAAVERLATSLSLGLGFIRRRRFRFAPPAGWRARPIGLFTELRHARGDAVISVAPAIPGDIAGPPLLDKLRLEEGLEELASITVLERRRLRTRAGLRGRLLIERGTFGGDPRVRGRASFADDLFLYCVRLDARTAAETEALAAYRALVDSIEPIRRPPSPRASATFSAWCD